MLRKAVTVKEDIIFLEFTLCEADLLHVGCEVLNFKNSHRIQQKLFSITFTFGIIIPRLVISYQLKAFKKPRYQIMFNGF